MGIWAFYRGLPQEDLDAIRADAEQPIEEVELSDEPTSSVILAKRGIDYMKF